jgi:hypothetical protein
MGEAKFNAHPSATLLSSDPVRIETASGWGAYGGTMVLPPDYAPGKPRIDGVDFVVERGSVLVQVQRADGSRVYGSRSLGGSPRGYAARFPAAALRDAKRILIRNGERHGTAVFRIERWHDAAETRGVYDPPDGFETAATGLWGRGVPELARNLRPGRIFADPEKAALGRALAASLEGQFPDPSAVRIGWSVCEWLRRRFDTSHICVILPFALGAAPARGAYWLPGSEVARDMQAGAGLGDAVAARLGAEAAGLDFLVNLDAALGLAMLLSRRDLRSLSKVVRKGLVVKAAMDDRLIGASVAIGERDEILLGTESARALLHECGFFDVAAVAGSRSGDLDLHGALVTRDDAAGYYALSAVGDATGELHQASLPLRHPLLVATHGPLVDGIDL